MESPIFLSYSEIFNFFLFSKASRFLLFSVSFFLFSPSFISYFALVAHMMQPYLKLRATLSLAWLSHLLITMLLIGISLFLLLSSIDYAIIDAKDSVAASCRGVQGGASVLASIPFYTAESINSMNKKAAEDVIKGAAEVLDIALLSIEAIAIFIVDMYRSLFICLLNLAVHGSLDLIFAATGESLPRNRRD